MYKSKWLLLCLSHDHIFEEFCGGSRVALCFDLKASQGWLLSCQSLVELNVTFIKESDTECVPYQSKPVLCTFFVLFLTYSVGSENHSFHCSDVLMVLWEPVQLEDMQLLLTDLGVRCFFSCWLRIPKILWEMKSDEVMWRRSAPSVPQHCSGVAMLWPVWTNAAAEGARIAQRVHLRILEGACIAERVHLRIFTVKSNLWLVRMWSKEAEACASLPCSETWWLWMPCSPGPIHRVANA